MAGKRFSGNPVPVSDLATGILDPMLRKRAGISVGLVQSWEEIVGPRLAQLSRPERVQWPRRMNEHDPFQPAALVIACEGVAALHIQHQTDEIIGRVNAFLGFAAIGRVRIVQKPASVRRKPPAPAPRTLSKAERSQVASAVGGIEDEALRKSLERLGSAVLGFRK
ncbi:MAG: DUF721 domain-containing protein [Mesorhizobium sp.]|nr:DUF721 domain-containing protein [Mesorhizobium sp.]MBN9244810.1 DUF721 domain-containing protein [Mesorhizobium sp.]